MTRAGSHWKQSGAPGLGRRSGADRHHRDPFAPWRRLCEAVQTFVRLEGQGGPGVGRAVVEAATATHGHPLPIDGADAQDASRALVLVATTLWMAAGNEDRASWRFGSARALASEVDALIHHAKRAQSLRISGGRDD